MSKLMLVLSLLLLPGFATAAAETAYAGQQAREIKALSAEETQAYLAGKGMGLAKAAELNGYPGPSHVLALADELQLSAEQKEGTATLFRRMETRSQALGRQLIDQEQRLDGLFASGKITRTELETAMKRIGELQGQIRQTHLETHLDQVDILRPEQIQKYMVLRGYADQAAAHSPTHHHKH